MVKIIGENFFSRRTTVVAKELLGKFLVRKVDGGQMAVMIVETEAYDGFADKASHAFLGQTQRTRVMFGQPGVFYVYLCYGMHYLLNVVTREQGYPAAVLIRGVIGSKNTILNGPGKITKFLKIDKNINCQKADKRTGLWFEDHRVKVNENKILRTHRIGVKYSGPYWSSRKMRFVLRDHLDSANKIA